MEHLTFVLVALFILIFGLFSGRFQRSIITAPIAFVGFGLIAGPLGFNLIHVDAEGELVKLLAELTLVLILFSDASRIHFKTLRSEYSIPLRLLGIGLPLTFIFGALIAAVFFEALAIWEAALIAAILSPTDAALGQAVVSNKRVPIRIRQALNVESGLNDGLALPLVLLLISLASVESGSESLSFWLGFTAQQVFLGLAAGVGIGFLGAKLIVKATETKSMNMVFQELSAVAMALLCFAFAELVGGNGFIAAFVGGLTLGNISKHACESLHEFAEAEGQLLTLITFLIFGAGMVALAVGVENWSWMYVVYGLLSLTVIRIIPVVLSTIGLKLRWDSILYLGWFGPRGIASILFGLLVLEESGIPYHEEIFAIVVTTVLISVFAHGITAWPLAQKYADRLDKSKHEVDMPEHMDVPELPPRIPFVN
jgi:NhaP-type Na+/H+ or K+/H+ antiporter